MSDVVNMIAALVVVGFVLVYLVALMWVHARLINPMTVRAATAGKKWQLAAMMGTLETLPTLVFVPLVTVIYIALFSLRAGEVVEGAVAGPAVIFVICLAISVPQFLLMVLVERALIWREQRYYEWWLEWGRSLNAEAYRLYFWLPIGKWRQWQVWRWAIVWRAMWPIIYPGGAKPNPFTVDRED